MNVLHVLMYTIYIYTHYRHTPWLFNIAIEHGNL